MEKISYERRVYESVDDKSLSWDIYILKNRLKNVYFKEYEYGRKRAVNNKIFAAIKYSSK